jgi:hypothetical protein
VHEQERWPLATHERPDPGPAVLIDPLLEAGQEIHRIRHVDRLWFGHCEFDGDQAGSMNVPFLRPDKLEIQAR